MPTRQDFIDSCRKMDGVLWRHMGRDRKHGVDCIGLLILGARDIGLTVADTPHYSRHQSDTELQRTMAQFLRRIPPTEAKPGDIILFRTESSGHVGVKTERGVLHAHAGRRKVCEEQITPDLVPLAVYRHPVLKD